MRRIHDNRRAGRTHDGQTAHVAYQVPVAKGRSAFAAHEAIGIKSGFLSSRAGLGNHVGHIAGSEELPLLDIDGFARLRTGPDEVRLAAKESRRLKHIHDRRDRRHFRFGMHVREDRHAYFSSHLGEDLEPLFHAQTAETLSGGAVGLVVAGLEDVRDTEFGGDLLHLMGNVERHRFGFDHAETGNEKERTAVADFISAELQSASP